MIAVAGRQARVTMPRMDHTAMVLVAACLAIGASLPAADEDSEKLGQQALAAFRKGDHADAITLASEAIAKSPEQVGPLALRAQFHAGMRAHDKAVVDYTAALKLEKEKGARAELLQRRGEAHFKLAKIKESIADFDSYLEINPGEDPQHWMRGLSYYYAGEFVKGQKQFERHQTVNGSDVENAVWHYLCLARAKNVEAALKVFIPIEGDSRVPMMEVHALFGGKSTPEKVLAKAREGDAAGRVLERQLFYAHLYLALWYEAKADDKKRNEYIAKAAAVANNHGYMGDVARVHAQLRGVKPAP